MDTFAVNEVVTSTATTESKTFREHVLEALDRYFSTVDGLEPIGVHSLVLEEVESALYEAVMKFTKGNQSRAAKLMGVSRGTLRTKLKQYFNTTHVGLED